MEYVSPTYRQMLLPSRSLSVGMNGLQIMHGPKRNRRVRTHYKCPRIWLHSKSDAAFSLHNRNWHQRTNEQQFCTMVCLSSTNRKCNRNTVFYWSTKGRKLSSSLVQRSPIGTKSLHLRKSNDCLLPLQRWRATFKMVCCLNHIGIVDCVLVLT